MGEYADDSWDPGDRWSWTPKEDYLVRPRHDRRRHKILVCPVCGKQPLHFLEMTEGEWYLADYDENNVLQRHVCSMKKRFGRLT